MKKEIKDYLPLYIGCEVWYKEKLWDLVGVSNPYRTNDTMFVNVDLRPEGKGFRSIAYISESFTDLSLIKPILRPLSDMTEEEKIMLCCLNMPVGWEPGHIIQTNDEDISAMRIFDMKGEYKSLYIPKNRISPNNFLWLLSQHFDLFGLIESGLAIDKTINTINK